MLLARWVGGIFMLNLPHIFGAPIIGGQLKLISAWAATVIRADFIPKLGRSPVCRSRSEFLLMGGFLPYFDSFKWLFREKRYIATIWRALFRLLIHRACFQRTIFHQWVKKSRIFPVRKIERVYDFGWPVWAKNETAGSNVLTGSHFSKSHHVIPAL